MLQYNTSNAGGSSPLKARATAAWYRTSGEAGARATASSAARLASAGGEPDAALAGGLGMRTNTFLQNFGRARRLLSGCLRGKGVALEELP